MQKVDKPERSLDSQTTASVSTDFGSTNAFYGG